MKINSLRMLALVASFITTMTASAEMVNDSLLADTAQQETNMSIVMDLVKEINPKTINAYLFISMFLSYHRQLIGDII